jgi:signal transduction histidine kinase
MMGWTGPLVWTTNVSPGLRSVARESSGWLRRGGLRTWKPMKLGLKSTLGVLAGYSLLMIAFTLGMDRWLRSLEEKLSADTVRLLAREQANLLVERSLATIEHPDPVSQRRLRERVQDITLLSDVVSSVAVVDRDGRVIETDDPRLGPQLAPASALFGRPARPRAELAPRESFLQGGDYTAFLPLMDGEEVAGYLRLVLHNDQVASFYREGRVRLLAIALLGLAGVGVLGVALQVHLARHAASITAVLEGVPETARRPFVPKDEFARALSAASRMRGALDEARRQSERRGQQVGAVADALRVGVVLLRRDLQVDYVSERAVELMRVSDEAAFKAAWAGETQELVRAALDRPPTGSDGSWSVLLDVLSDRRRLHAEVHRLESEDGADHVVLLSDRRALDALEADVRLASQLEGLARVYRTMAHELKAPLSAMMINLDLLRESLSKGEAPEPGREGRQQHYVEVLRDELNRLNRSLYSILTQTVPDAKPQEFDLTSSLADLAALLAPQARRQAVQLETCLGNGALVVRGYPDRLRQAFLNVAVNALEAMPRGGRLTVEATAEGGQAKVALRDTGPGIGPGSLERIYDLDFSTKEGGSGIGLYVARALVELHGGEIRVESAAGRGTDVYVSLPRVTGAA